MLTGIVFTARMASALSNRSAHLLVGASMEDSQTFNDRLRLPRAWSKAAYELCDRRSGNAGFTTTPRHIPITWRPGVGRSRYEPKWGGHYELFGLAASSATGIFPTQAQLPPSAAGAYNDSTGRRRRGRRFPGADFKETLDVAEGLTVRAQSLRHQHPADQLFAQDAQLALLHGLSTLGTWNVMLFRGLESMPTMAQTMQAAVLFAMAADLKVTALPIWSHRLQYRSRSRYHKVAIPV